MRGRGQLLAALVVCASLFIAPGVGAAGYTAKTPRGQAAGQIIAKWSAYVGTVYHVTPMQWARNMERTFAQADIGNLQRAVRRDSYEAMMGTLLGQRITDKQVARKFAASDRSLSTLKSLGSPAQDLVYTMVDPCRIVDTRLTAAGIPEGSVRSFKSSDFSFAAQGGSNGDCSIPAGASAIAMNVTVVSPDGAGHLTVFPYGVAKPLASDVNYRAGDILANQIIAKQAIGQAYDFAVYSQARTDVVIDVNGYFMAPQVSPLECYTTGTEIAISPGMQGTVQAECPSERSMTGGGCYWHYGFDNGPITMNFPAFEVPEKWRCSAFNRTVETKSLAVSARCCRIPGR